MTEIIPQELVDCTAAVSARYSVGFQPQASLTAICNKAGADLDDAIFYTAAPRERYKKIESFGGQLR